ncbi:hypothetical protein HN51_060714 [Arachis hypogaea]|uniref:B3 domain-containing transcription factor VRN1-like isoform X1 n=1 Tax=Arachis ipaensis TaxID=130454 RepID=UPI000A2B0C4F|nr:B3 domain-containing transcription factor VRN1-like isoform X1 [Arachis ipaensis]XP_025682760.1 B3 domain-containing transcription factor VRN1 [Arachis hypogaea]
MPLHERGFFKVLVQSFKHELKIPKPFVKEYWRGVSNPIVLKLPNTLKQRVYWIRKNEDEIWLEEGWEQVVKDFGLEYSQFLTFDYKGWSCFEVKIYPKNDSEIMPPHHQICFFQILVHNKFYQKLRVPKCANECWKRMSNPIKLVLPYGVERKVNWTKRGEKIWLEQGWEKVVELCGLSHQWLLTFDYNGMSRFEVKVYDNTTLRVAYYDEYDVENNKDVDETESEDDDDDDDDDDNDDDDDDEDEDDDDDDGDDGDFAEDYCDEEYHYKFVQEHFKRKKTNTVNGSNRNPSFKIRIQESYVGSRCVAIPATFARKHLEEGPIRMIVGNRAWTVCYKTWRGRARYRKHKLQSGWLRFRRENNLEVGDVCVFELISKFPQTMIVRVQSG